MYSPVAFQKMWDTTDSAGCFDIVKLELRPVTMLTFWRRNYFCNFSALWI